MKMGLTDLQAVEMAQNRQGNVWKGLTKKRLDLEKSDKKKQKSLAMAWPASQRPAYRGA